MPLHLQSIIQDEQVPDYFTDLLMMVRNDPDEVFVTTDTKYILSRFILTDELSGDPFGKIVFTMKNDDEQNALMILDLDITLDNDHRTALQFLTLQSGSSESNEYYTAGTADGHTHLELETVCRHVINEKLEDSRRDVSISVFPFEASIYESIDEFNQKLKTGKRIRGGETRSVAHGISESFMVPVITIGNEDDEHYSFFLGKVLSWQEIRWSFGQKTLDFLIVWLKTALGDIPAAMSSAVFDLSKLRKGSILAISADIKADLSKPEDFTIVH